MSRPARRFDPEAVNLVVLASDGVANVGRTGPNSIVDQIQEEGADGIHLVTVGYGLGNYNDHLMEQLADLGDGFYAYVDTYGEAEQLFGEDLVTTLTPVAAEARSPGRRSTPSWSTSYRLIGYDNRAIADEDFTDAGIDAGELGAGHHATALYEVRLADGVEPGDVYGTASVRWTPVGTGRTGSDDVQEEASIDLVATDGDPGPSYRLSLAATVADLAQVLKQAAPYADRGVTLEESSPGAQGLADADVAGAEDLVTARRAGDRTPVDEVYKSGGLVKLVDKHYRLVNDAESLERDRWRPLGCTPSRSARPSLTAPPRCGRTRSGTSGCSA